MRDLDRLYEGREAVAEEASTRLEPCRVTVSMMMVVLKERLGTRATLLTAGTRQVGRETAKTKDREEDKPVGVAMAAAVVAVVAVMAVVAVVAVVVAVVIPSEAFQMTAEMVDTSMGATHDSLSLAHEHEAIRRPEDAY